MAIEKYLERVLDAYPICDPIYLSDILKAVKNQFHITVNGKDAITALDKMVESKDNLRKYNTGIYYKTKLSPLGSYYLINDIKLIHDKYIVKRNGYETGYRMLTKLGLTTQIPNITAIKYNGTKKRYFQDLRIICIPSKIHITNENKKYLKFLDVVELLDMAPINNDNYINILMNYMFKRNININQLFDYAKKYYPRHTQKNLQKLIDDGGVINEAP